MNNKKIVLAGGTGFIGKYLQAQFLTLGYEVILISRQKNNVSWENENALINALENAEMLINLAGKSVDCRYNEKNKKEIFDSRINTTTILGNAILRCKNPPPIWMNSSTATIYRHAMDRPMTEVNGEIGSGFSVNVATNWEQTFFSFKLPNTRQVALRIAIVLGKNGGVVKPLTNLVKAGLGGKQGRGNQMFSWLHVHDLYNILLFIQQNKNIEGAVNCSAPNPVTNNVLMQTFRKKLNISFGLPMPKWLLEFGAIFIKTETELILKGRWVLPEKLLQHGFTFSYPLLVNALNEIFDNKKLHHEKY